MSNITNGNFCMLLYTLAYTLKIIQVQKYNFQKEINLPTSLKLDAAIFDDPCWFNKYEEYHIQGNIESLEWLKEHLIVAIEFKKEDNKNVSEVWDKQLKAYLNESQRNFAQEYYMILNVYIYFVSATINS